jgi:hypothetical protein
VILQKAFHWQLCFKNVECQMLDIPVSNWKFVFHCSTSCKASYKEGHLRTLSRQVSCYTWQSALDAFVTSSAPRNRYIFDQNCLFRHKFLFSLTGNGPSGVSAAHYEQCGQEPVPTSEVEPASGTLRPLQKQPRSSSSVKLRPSAITFCH